MWATLFRKNLIFREMAGIVSHVPSMAHSQKFREPRGAKGRISLTTLKKSLYIWKYIYSLDDDIFVHPWSVLRATLWPAKWSCSIVLHVCIKWNIWTLCFHCYPLVTCGLSSYITKYDDLCYNIWILQQYLCYKNP